MSIRVRSYNWFSAVNLDTKWGVLKRSGTFVPGAGCYGERKSVLPEYRFDTELEAKEKAIELQTISQIENT